MALKLNMFVTFETHSEIHLIKSITIENGNAKSASLS